MGIVLSASELEPVVFRRPGSRKVLRRSGHADAAALMGDLRPGDEIAGITNGQFSLIDILQHLLSQVGESDVCIATWTMGVYDAEKAYEFVNDSRIRRIRFVLDPSMFSRRPELSAVLVRGFGVEAFRGVNSHAKFMTVRGAEMAVCVRSSMNLNENNRLESFDLSVCDETTRFYEQVVDDIWARIAAGNKSQARSIFDEILEAPAMKNPRRANPFRD